MSNQLLIENEFIIIFIVIDITPFIVNTYTFIKW